MRVWKVGLAGAMALAASVAAAPGPRVGPGAVAELLEIAQSEKEPEGRRAQAIRLMENTPVRTQMPALRKLLREERSLDIRLSAACTLAALGDRSAPRDLLLATAYDGERTPNCTRTDVIVALGQLGDPAAELHLGRALREDPPRDEPEFLTQACRALAALRTPGARTLLHEALRDPRKEVREAAIAPVAALALDPKNPDRRLSRQLLVLVARREADEGVAERAGVALFWAGVDGPGFFDLLEKDPDPKVRARAARVMDRHYLSAARLQRLRTALGKEPDPAVRAAMEATLASQARGQLRDGEKER